VDDFVPGPEMQQTLDDLQSYLTAMQAYVECVRAELDAAGGDAAPQPLRGLLVRRNNVAIAEAQAVQQIWADRIEALGLPAE